MTFEFHHPIFERPVLNLLPKKLTGLSILDVGCGVGFWGFMLRVDHSVIYSPFSSELVGLDVFKRYLEKLAKMRIYDSLILAEATHLPFREGSFDIVLLIEVLEHLDRESGLLLLDSVERLVKKLLIVVTPNAFWPTGDANINGNPYQSHKSTWRTVDFLSKGYKVFTVGRPLLWKRVNNILSDMLHLIFASILTVIPFDRVEREFIIAYKKKPITREHRDEVNTDQPGSKLA